MLVQTHPMPTVARHHNGSCERPETLALNGGASPGSVAGLIYIARAAPGLRWLHSQARLPLPHEACPAKLATKKRDSGDALRRTGEDKLANPQANVKRKVSQQPLFLYGSISTASNARPTTSRGVIPVATASVLVSKKSISPPWIT